MDPIRVDPYDLMDDLYDARPQPEYDSRLCWEGVELTLRGGSDWEI